MVATCISFFACVFFEKLIAHIITWMLLAQHLRKSYLTLKPGRYPQFVKISATDIKHLVATCMFLKKNTSTTIRSDLVLARFLGGSRYMLAIIDDYS
jgi:hypothetical protein